MDQVYWVEEGRLAGRPGPTWFPWDLDQLYAHGFRAIVSLETDMVDPEAIRASGMEHKVIYIPDHTAPTQEQIREFIAYAEEKMGEGKPVLVHCLGGVGRTGTMLAAWLIRKGMDAEEAIRTIREIRPHPLTIEPPQEEALRRFARSL
ncbi:MAG: hypothetical protein GXO65_01115 [Euryarchaeota archaeon]|nr:hypothetical protein [Euryarchaeota archaeon]